MIVTSHFHCRFGLKIWAFLLLFHLQCVSFLAAADGLGSIAIDTTQLNMSVTDPTAWATAMNNLGMVPVGLAGQQLVTGKIFLF